MSVIVNASTSTGLGITSDNSGIVEVQSNGTTKLTVASTGVYGTVTSDTAKATTSGTTVDFTGIPSWVKKITIMFNRVSTNGTSNIGIQLGSGSVETTGYISNFGGINNTPGYFSGGTSLLIVWFSPTNTSLMTGHITLTLVSSNLWLHSGVLDNGITAMGVIAGSKTISGTLDRIRITTVNGTDVFDAGSINIFYEG